MQRGHKAQGRMRLRAVGTAMPVLGHIAGAALADSVREAVHVEAAINARQREAHLGATAAASEWPWRWETPR